MAGGIFDGSPIIEGGTDGTIIGNVGDRLKVDASFTDSGKDNLDSNRVYSLAASVNMATGGADNNIFLFRNSSLTKKIYIQSFYAGVNINNVYTLFKLWSGPTITTNGTLQTSVGRFLGNSAPAAIGLGYTLPTISNRGTNFDSIMNGQNTSSSNLVEKDLAMNPGQFILLTGQPNSNNREAIITMTWVEL